MWFWCGKDVGGSDCVFGERDWDMSWGEGDDLSWSDDRGMGGGMV